MNKFEYLVVGASGYLGKEIYEELLMSGSNVLGTCTHAESNYIKLDLSTPFDFNYNLISKHTIIFLLAAISTPDVCSKRQDFASNINVIGTSYFIDKAIARGGRIIFFSSDTIYGHREIDFDESTHANPMGEYAAMKYKIESRFKSDSNFKSIRLSYVFSRDDKFSMYVANCAKDNCNVEVFHPFSRSVIHRKDVVQGAIALARRWDTFQVPVINFGGPKTVSRLEFAETFKQLEAFRKLEICVSGNSEAFFESRPRCISMRSPILSLVLEKSPRSLSEAMIFEFPKSQLNSRIE